MEDTNPDVQIEDGSISSESSTDKEPVENPVEGAEDGTRGEPLDADPTDPDEGEGEEEPPVEGDGSEDPNAVIAKKDEQIKNLNKALAEERARKRELGQPTREAVAQKATPAQKESDPISLHLVKANEKEALNLLYTKYPQLAPENDQANVLYGHFSGAYKKFADDYQQEHGVAPLTKDAIYSTAIEAMEFLEYRRSKQSKSKSIQATQAKAKMANVGTSSNTRQKQDVVASDEDVKRARVARMPIDKYMKYKDRFDKDTVVI